MPVARFQMPDGRVARYEVPEGTTPEQAQQMISESLGAEKPSARDAFLATLPPDRRALAESGMLGKDLTKAAFAQETSGMGGIDAALAQFAGMFSGPGEKAKNRILGSIGLKPDPSAGVSEMRSAVFDEAPVSSVGGGLAGAISQFALGGKTIPKAVKPELAAAVKAHPYLSNTMLGSTLGAHEDGTSGAILGGLGGMLGTAAGQGLGWLGGKATDMVKGGANIIDTALLPGGAKRAVGRITDKAAGDKKVIEALMKAKAGESAGQASVPAGSAEFTALQRIADAEIPSQAVARDVGQEVGRKALLSSVTPDKASAIAARTQATNPLYEQASQAEVPIVGKLRELFDRMPSETLTHAKNLAKTDGRPFMLETGDGKAVTSGETMHYIKRALSDIANARTPVAGGGQDYQRSVGNLLDEFTKIYGGKKPSDVAANPLYGEARRRFAEKSIPVNQSQILEEMQSVLAKPGGGERVTPFLNVLGRGEEALLKRSTGFPRAESGDLAKQLAPDQMRAVTNIAGEMERDLAEQALGKAGQSKALEIMRMGEKKGVVAPGLIDTKISVTNYALRLLEGKGGKRVNEEMARLMQPQNLPELVEVMKAAKPSVRAKLLNEMSKNGLKLGGGLTGSILRPDYGQEN